MALKPRDRVLNLNHRFVQVVKLPKNEHISIIPLGDTTSLRNVRDDIPVEPYFFVFRFFLFFLFVFRFLIASFFCACNVRIVIGPFVDGGGFNFR